MLALLAAGSLSSVAVRHWRLRAAIDNEVAVDGCARTDSHRSHARAARTAELPRTDAHTEIVRRELRCTSTGELSYVQSPEVGYGRGIGAWRRLPSGAVAGRLQLYLYTTAEQPDQARELLLLGLEAEGGELVCCVFAAGGGREQIGVLQASACSSQRRALLSAH
eukprot:569157-Prymnesium_polylepis.1